MIRFLKSAADFVAALVVEGKSVVVEESPAALAARSAQPQPLTFLIFLKRSGVVLCMSALAWLILLVTPPLDRTFLSCERPCHELDWPMICRIKLTLEVYQTLSWSCGECPSNQTDCFNANCVTADGVPQGLLTANRQLPGPSIQVCENDILVVDVWNRVPGAGVGVHWRGMTQKETPFMDGVPMVTQCPIPAHTTFQYKFRASKAGTHLWHAHAGAESADGLFGALIVRQPSSRDPQRRHYDVDDMDHVIVIAEWARGFALQRLADAHHKPSAGATMEGRDLVDTLLINGRGKLHTSDAENNEMDVDPESDEVEKKDKSSSASESPMATFNVRPGLRHRFRMANAGGVAGCPVRVSIDNHLLTVIALDGNPIQTAQVKSFVLSPGERADFVVTADQPIGNYWMRASADKAEGKELHPNCRSLKQKAIVHYKSSDYKPKLNFAFPEKLSSYPSPHNHPSNSEEGDATAKVLLNSVDDVCIAETDSLCVTEVHSLHKLDPDLAVPKVDRTIYLPFDFQLVATDNVSYPPFLVPGTKDVRVPRVANLTFMYPPSPLVTQASDVPYDLRCSQDLLPQRCPTTVAGRRREGSAAEKGHTDVCECVHQIDIGLGETVELMLVDEGGASDWGHVFHLHGYSFHVVALGSFESDIANSNRIEALKDMDKKGKLPRNLVDPVVKDTVFIPSGGYAVLRFKADNPGYWLLHDQHISHSAWGLNVILHVGSDNQLPPTPPDFPKCGSWVGPEFFLI